jgi:transaldolase
MTDALARLSEHGVSVWLDDLSRELLAGGDLARLVRDRHVVGVTSNPTIFASALAKSDRYTDQLRALADRGVTVADAVFEVTTDDVRTGCDVLAPVYEATGRLDGRVSIEVDPRLAHDGAATTEAARALWRAVDRPNAMVKIPATVEGLPAISTALGEGINVNVTLIFSLDRYRAVMNAFLLGLEQASRDGLDLSAIASVASFFVSRVDTEVDKRLEAVGSDEALARRGKAGIANARLAYQAYEEVFSTPRWAVLADAGARPQRPLWASTGVKNPAFADTMYVTELVAPGTVSTMPGATLEAVADHGDVVGDTVRGRYGEAEEVLDSLERLGIGYADVTSVLEREGVEKFEKSWEELLATVSDELARLSAMESDEEAHQ